MPDHHILDVGDSAEHVAFRLFEMIMAKDPPKAPLTLNATWILTTYARCLRTVKNPESAAPKTSAFKVTQTP